MPVYRRRHISKAKHTLKSHKNLSDCITDNDNDTKNHEDEVLSKRKNKIYEHERSKKLTEENNFQKTSFDKDDADSGNLYVI